MEKQLTAALAQITKILLSIESELSDVGRILRRETNQKISESKTRERQVRRQIMLAEAQRKRV